MRGLILVAFVVIAGGSMLPESVFAASSCEVANGGFCVRGTSAHTCPTGTTYDVTSSSFCAPSGGSGTEEYCCVTSDTSKQTSLCTAAEKQSYCKPLASCAPGTVEVVAGGCSCSHSGNVYCVPATVAPVGGAGVGVALAAGSTVTTSVRNPLAFNTVEGVLDKILMTIRGIIVLLSLVFIVLGALFYIMSGGDEGRIKFAKGAITAAVIGLALGIAAPSFLKEIGAIIGWGGAATGAVSGSLTIAQIARNTLNFLLSVFGILAIIMLVVGGVMYLSSAGSEDRIDTAKKIVKWSIIGIMVAFASYLIVNQIASLLAIA